ncbi:MAG TPA: Rne/Rng family ribonuclease [Blastocatellia bacterium]|nr:Rne/Rng family ribonuclease [Blastocatellia bacterium]
MSKELIVSVNGREKKIAIVEDDAVTEFYVERGDENQGIVGNIYKGRVMKVLPGMQSAFVDIGLERDSFLYVSDFLDEDEFEETVTEERKEAARQAIKPERARHGRGAPRIETFNLPEADEEKDLEQEMAALRHIEEISTEPRIDPESEEDSVEVGEAGIVPGADTEAKDDLAEISPRQRRQRRLRYVEPGGEEERAPSRGRSRESASSEITSTTSSSRTERAERPERAERAERAERPERAERAERPERTERAERTERPERAERAERPERAERAERPEGDSDEFGSGRRRRRRRRRGGESSDPEFAVVGGEESSDEIAIEPEMEEIFEGTPYIIVHHEPLERITDDDFVTDGELLKDALLQERIAERIHEEERRTSLLEVDPTPEVHVGSLQHAIFSEPGLERISDDPDGVQERAEIEARSRWHTESAEGEPIEIRTEPEQDAESESETSHGSVNHLADGGDIMHLDLTVGRPENEEAHANGEVHPEEELKDSSAEIRQRTRRGDFATRRGGRGRRRGFRQRPNNATETVADGDDHDNGSEHESAASLPPVSRSIDRFHHRPVISDLLREGQEIIVQIAKEPIGQKGARITSHIALPGRYIVYMPTVEHIGVSRKIGTDEERQRLKRTLHQLRAESGVGGGFIVRTAANGCPLDELREDMQYLIRTWTDIRRRAERIKAPTIVHRDLDLIQRILRDQLSSDFSAIRVDNEFEYERIVDFVNRFAPKLVNRVKLYTKETPILEHYGVQAEIDKAVKPRVWLKSGGYIVINQTEALVAIDVNTGKFVGKSNRLEDTIVKTNLEAAKEIVRQIRLRDLGGIIVLDFIDMEERRNRQKVMQALEQELRSDRSPSKILQFNDFGLVAITRKRVKQSLERTLCTPCHYCGGGGMIKSAQTICYEILAESRRVSKEVDSHNEVILRVNPEVAKTLRGTERDILAEIEAYLGGVVTIKSDPTIHQEQFDIALA